MASPMPTFATLRALQLIIADALNDIQRVFSQHNLPGPPSSPPSNCTSPAYPGSPVPSPVMSPFPATPPTSFPPTPLSATFPSNPRSPNSDMGASFLDYPSPDLPLVPDSPSEQLALHSDVAAAASRIVAACGQMSNIVHKPFSSLCDAIMSYNLPACMRLVEHLHVAEIIRETEESRYLAIEQEPAAPLPGPSLNTVDIDVRIPPTGMALMHSFRAHDTNEGLHVTDITKVISSYAGINYVDSNDLLHALRLLSTHHIFRETAPDTFALTRVASLLDSGKSVETVFSNPKAKYDDTDGTSAFVSLITDELFKSAAYLTEAFTGVQLPTPAFTPDLSCSANATVRGTNTIPSTSNFAISDQGAPTTRSSSVLTHIMYPKSEGIHDPSHSPLSSELPENDALVSHGTEPILTRPLPMECSLSPPARPNPVEVSAQMPESRLYSGCEAKPEKLPAFNLAFRTPVPFFEWLENGGEDALGGTGRGACIHSLEKRGNIRHDNARLVVTTNTSDRVSPTPFRLARFSRAMMGTTQWEVPKAILNGFDWYSLPKGATIVDVGGGIGSTTMILARALNIPNVDSAKRREGTDDEGPQPTSVVSMVSDEPSSLVGGEPRNNPATDYDVKIRFVVQDRPVVTSLGVEAWRSKCPEMLESGQVVFQDQDFFEPQLPFEPPHLSRHPAVYLLRVVLHDWPDEAARRILINLRVASNEETRLVIAEHVIPLACIDGDVVDNVNAGAREESSAEEWTLDSVLALVQGTERSLATSPLLPNLGKASAHAYWMDLLMHIVFNGKERTLREFCALALSAGWRVTRMTRPEGTLFAYLVCEPIPLPDDAQAIYNAVVLSSELSTVVAISPDEPLRHSRMDHSRHKCLPDRPTSLLPSAILERSSSRCGTPTFGSRLLLPKDEELQSPRTRGAGGARKWLKSKGLGVRSVVIQKAEKYNDQSVAKGSSARTADDVPNEARAPSSQMRVWWKKSPPNSTSNSNVRVNELSGETPEHRFAGLARPVTTKSSVTPSTPSPRASPAHQKWPSTDSATLLASEASPLSPRVRRRSVASITRKLSFATFGRKPSVADISEPLPTPPPGTRLTSLASPPNLQGDCTGQSPKHLPSLQMLGGSDVIASVAGGNRPIPRRPSFSFTDHMPPPQPLKSAIPRRPDTVEQPKAGILKPRINPYTGIKQGSPDPGYSANPKSMPQRQRSVTLSNSPAASSRTQAQSPYVGVPSDLGGREVKRIPSMPKLPRRLSIPMLRRKQSQSAIQAEENGA